MDLKKIERLMELMKSYGVDELEVVSGEEKIRVRKPGAPGSLVTSQPVVGVAAPAAVQTGPTLAVADIPKPPAAPSKGSRKVITSPFVGTFYRAPSPGAEPFVSVGQRVKKGDVLCIVEAMKLMNEIEAESECVIAEILIENGQPVEFDQPLFVLE